MDGPRRGGGIQSEVGAPPAANRLGGYPRCHLLGGVPFQTPTAGLPRRGRGGVFEGGDGEGGWWRLAAA